MGRKNFNGELGRGRLCVEPKKRIAKEEAGLNMATKRVTCGAISFNSSSHFPPMLVSKLVKPVVLPPGVAKLRDEAALDRLAYCCEHDRYRASRLLRRRQRRPAVGHDYLSATDARFEQLRDAPFPNRSRPTGNRSRDYDPPSIRVRQGSARTA